MLNQQQVVGASLGISIGANLGVFDSISATVDINMPPLQGLDLCLKMLL